MYPHLRFRNVEIIAVDLDNKVLSLTVHYVGNESDLMQDRTQAKLNMDVATALAHFRNQRYFEDDDLANWRVPACVMVHPPINHE